MAKYSLLLTKKDEESILVDIDPVKFDELDEITRKYTSRKQLIEALIAKRILPYDRRLDGSWYVNIVILTKTKDSKKDKPKYKIYKTNYTPIYKEQYNAKHDDPIFEQILEFAKEIDSIYSYYAKSKTYYDEKKKEKKTKWYIPEDRDVRKSIMEVMKNMTVSGKPIQGLRNPKFYMFVKEHFIKNIHRKKALDNPENGDTIYVKDEVKFTGIDVFDSLVNNGRHDPVNEEIYINFYNDLLYGFHKTFFNQSKNGFNLNYLGVRKFYKEYYEKFIRPLIKNQAPGNKEDGIQMTLEDYISEQFEERSSMNKLPSIKPSEYDEKYINNDGSVENIYIDEINEPDYFPDEHPNDPRIKISDGHYEFAADDTKTL